MFLLLGRLRRDTMILGSSENQDDIQLQAERAVLEGRAQETYVVEAIGYFTATEHNWQGTDQGLAAAKFLPASVPALNPHNGEQESLDTSSSLAPTSIREQISLSAEAAGIESNDVGLSDRNNEIAKGLNTQVVAGPDGKAPKPNEDVATSLKPVEQAKTEQAPVAKPADAILAPKK